MRIKVLILATAMSLPLASSSWGGVVQANVTAKSSVHLVAAKKLKPTMSIAKFKARGATQRSTTPKGCTYNPNSDTTHCTTICIASASGDMCVDHDSCYDDDREIPC